MFRIDRSHTEQDTRAEAKNILARLGSQEGYDIVVVELSGELTGAMRHEFPANAAVGGWAEIGNPNDPNADAVELVVEYLER